MYWFDWVKSAARPRRSERPKGAYGSWSNFLLEDDGGPQDAVLVGTSGVSNVNVILEN